MEALFKKYAGEVNNQGIFIFFFSGRGIYNDQGEFVGLPPKDYDGTINTMYITREVLRKWLNDSKCKAKYVLFMINSSRAGGFHGRISSPPASSDTPPDLTPPVLYVMFSSASDEISTALQCSIFCHSLSRAITNVSFSQSQLPIRDISNECSRVTHALTILQCTYKGKSVSMPQHSLKWAKIDSINQEQTEKEEVDLEYERVHLVKESLDWIKECEAENGPLDQLKNELLKDQSTVDTVLCFMMRSIVYIQLSQEPGAHATIASTYFFEIVYQKVVDTLKKYSELKFERRLGLEEFKNCLRESGITGDRLSKLQI